MPNLEPLSNFIIYCKETRDANYPEVTVSYSAWAYAEEYIPKLHKELEALTTREKALVDALEEATDFVDRHTEDWYKSGQELLAKCKQVLSQHKDSI